MVERYIFSGSLPEDATTYVTREADTQLYEGLKAGKFCYVLNSRQTGKSSLRVRTMRRLREEGFACVAIDLSFGGIQSVTPEQWYVDLLDTLIESLALEVDLEEWWFESKLLSPLRRFRKFIEEVLLVEILENIIIFIDEIDSVLSLNFPTDDFFAFIRACYNQRTDNPEYKRLSFCLLGVASPSELIADKKRTPFNIGQAIFLRGFQWSEVEPLKKGLQDKVDDLTTVMKEILEWTGGQPFLTQKLCQYVVEEADQETSRSVEEIVRARIITNWESQDEPEHLKTIRDRLLYRHEQWTGYLLELYQQIRQQGSIPVNDSLEQSELKLSGLVVKRQGKLVVTNPIYREVFNPTWIEEQLASLRPYAENYRAWLQSEKQDASRLLRGQALKDAETWASGKDLGGEDRDFLGASRAKEREAEIAQKEKEAELEREKKAREAAEKAEKIQAEANQKAQGQIRLGSIILILTLFGAGISSVWGSLKFHAARQAQSQAQEARQQQQTAKRKFEEVREQLKKTQKDVDNAEQRVEQAKKQEIKAKQQAESAEKKAQEAQKLEQNARQQLEAARQAKDNAEQALAKAEATLTNTNQALEAVRKLSQLAGKLRKEGEESASDEALRKAGLSTLIKNNEELKQAWLLAASAEAYQSFESDEERKQAQTAIEQSISFFQNNKGQLEGDIFEQVRAFAYFQAGRLNDEQQAYQSAYDALKASNFNPYALNVETDILTKQDVENIHYRLIKSSNIDINSSDEIANSFRKHLYDGLEFLLSEEQDRLKEADQETWEIMLYIADLYERGVFTVESLQNFSCPALREIDKRWYDYPKRPKHFGFRVQKEIWQKLGSPNYDSPIENWRKFYIELGWKTEESGIESGEGYVSYDNLGAFKDINLSRRGNLPGNLPYFGVVDFWINDFRYRMSREIKDRISLREKVFFSRAANCNL